ncbi:MAG: TonB-dependent receptor [Sphingobium sp.]|uniref:TonB-dependent receptor n=1 Tax=Sphingobium sp. TaxID=1912891 RepID=UPI000DB3F34A|nr:TonB-dependent receptor plug domain-containing protein [Sphingobium sp.]PZU07614.1 MAG: TonB-dependent receptor [Sphingobium sp.]
MSSFMRRHHARLLLSAGICLSVPFTALAQEASADRPTTASTDDIVVTARRESENIQSTPVSVVAFNEEMLRSANIQNTSDLMMKTPGVFLSGSGGRENSVFQIRGQSKALSGSNAPAVVSYFADVPQPTFGSGVSTYDMASVQVLKGPQGTLFGRNTTGGAVLYYPAAPSYKLEGYLEGGYGNYDRRQLEGALTLPIIDGRLSVRVAGRYEKRDGYTRNIGVGGDLDDVNSRAFRVSVLAEPTDTIRNLTIFDWYRNYYTGDAVVLTGVDASPSLLDLLGVRGSALAELAAQRARGPRVVNSDVEPAMNRTRRWGLTNRTDITLGDVELTNIFGYRKTYVEYNINTDGVPRLASNLAPGLTLPLLNAGAINNVEQYTEELQLKGSVFDDKVDWLLGGFYLKSRPYGTTGSGNGVGFFTSYPLATFQYNFYTENSRALFGNVNVKLDSLAQGLRLNAGVRYTWDKQLACVATQGTMASPNMSAPNIQPDECPSSPLLVGASVNRAKSSAPTWTLGLDWQVTPDLFTYVVSRRGYRTGGINTPTFGGRLTPYQSFGPEKVTDIEAGIRTDWNLGGDVKLRFNASAFSGWYNGVQIALSGLITQSAACRAGVNNPAPISPDGDCDPSNDPQSGTMLINAGKSRVAGIDLDGRIAFGSRLALTYGANFLDTKTRSLEAPAAVQPYLQQQKIPFDLVAKRTYTLGGVDKFRASILGEHQRPQIVPLMMTLRTI